MGFQIVQLRFVRFTVCALYLHQTRSGRTKGMHRIMNNKSRVAVTFQTDTTGEGVGRCHLYWAIFLN